MSDEQFCKTDRGCRPMCHTEYCIRDSIFKNPPKEVGPFEQLRFLKKEVERLEYQNALLEERQTAIRKTGFGALIETLETALKVAEHTLKIADQNGDTTAMYARAEIKRLVGER